MAIPWTTNRRFVAPAADFGVTLTPSGVAGTFSAWVELIASADADLALVGISLEDIGNPGGISAWSTVFEIGVGALGVETAVARIGHRTTCPSAGHQHTMLEWEVPRAVVSSGDRVSIRMTWESTSTDTWDVSLAYLKLPIVGTLVVCDHIDTIAPLLTPAATGSSVAWANTAWVTVEASAAFDGVLQAVQVSSSHNSQRQEIEIAVGPSDTIIHRERVTLNGLCGGTWYMRCCPPVAGIIAGQPIKARARDATSGNPAQSFKVHYTEAID